MISSVPSSEVISQVSHLTNCDFGHEGVRVQHPGSTILPPFGEIHPNSRLGVGNGWEMEMFEMLCVGILPAEPSIISNLGTPFRRGLRYLTP